MVYNSWLQGGQLVVEHAGKRKAFDFGNCKGYSVCCAAFYAGQTLARCTFCLQVLRSLVYACVTH